MWPGTSTAVQPGAGRFSGSISLTTRGPLGDGKPLRTLHWAWPSNICPYLALVLPFPWRGSLPELSPTGPERLKP